MKINTSSACWTRRFATSRRRARTWRSRTSRATATLTFNDGVRCVNEIWASERSTVQVRIVGSHQSEAVDQHYTGLLIDGWLAIDAGSLASGLTLDEQLAVTDVLVTHQHWDHVKDLGGFGFNRFSAQSA